MVINRQLEREDKSKALFLFMSKLMVKSASISKQEEFTKITPFARVCALCVHLSSIHICKIENMEDCFWLS